MCKWTCVCAGDIAALSRRRPSLPPAWHAWRHIGGGRAEASGRGARSSGIHTGKGHGSLWGGQRGTSACLLLLPIPISSFLTCGRVRASRATYSYMRRRLLERAGGGVGWGWRWGGVRWGCGDEGFVCEGVSGRRCGGNALKLRRLGLVRTPTLPLLARQPPHTGNNNEQLRRCGPPNQAGCRTRHLLPHPPAPFPSPPLRCPPVPPRSLAAKRAVKVGL